MTGLHTPPRHTRSLLLCGLLIALLGTACAEDEATFELSGGDGCYAEQFPFEPTFFAVTPTERGAYIRMERQARMRTASDAVILSLDGDDADLAGQTYTLDPENSTSYGVVRFLESCPESYANMHIRGTVTFDSYGTDSGDIISGSVSGELIDILTRDSPDGPVATITSVGPISGTFSFEMRKGPPYQSFTTPPTRAP